MVNQNIRETFRQFADRLARQQTSGQLELNQDDPDADVKFGAFVDQSASQLEQQTGKPKQNTFRELFSAATGSLGAVRDAGQEVIGRGFDASLGQALGRTAETIAPVSETQPVQALDRASAASAGAATNALVAPLGSTERGIGSIAQFQYDPRTGQLVAPQQIDPNQFDAFLRDVGIAREGGAIDPAGTAFRQENINPALKLGIEAGADLTNLIPGSAVARGLRLGGRAADATQAGRLADVAQTGAREIPTAATRGAAQAERNAVRASRAPEVVPFGPNRTTEGVPGDIPSGAADDVPPGAGDDVARGADLPPEDSLELEVQRARETIRQRGQSTPKVARDIQQAQEKVAREAPATPASTLDEQWASIEQEIAREHVQRAAAGNPPPRKPGTPLMGGNDIPPPRDTATAMADDFQIPTHEKVDQAVFRKWSGARNVERLQINQWYRGGQKALRAAGMPDNPERSPELVDLFRALDGEISPDTLAPQYREVHDYARTIITQESADMKAFLGKIKDEDAALFGLDAKAFINKISAHPDYFPRGWKNKRDVTGPGRGNMGSKPGFAKARSDATFSEILESGMEPATWNPIALAAMRRLAGVEYREQVKALHILKKHGKVLPVSQAPDGWRVPKIGPAFEGRPVGVDEAGNTIRSEPFAVPNYIRRGEGIRNAVETDLLAQKMETLWGGAGTYNEWLKKFTQGSNILKRGKLLFSFFQHLDFLYRGEASLFAPTSIIRGKTVKAPSLAADLLRAQWWAPQRRAIEKEILSGKPLYKDFPISLKMVAEEGWEVAGDKSLIQKAFLDVIDNAMADAPRNKAVRGLKQAKDFFEKGLFEGVYPTAQASALKNHLIPNIKMLHPNWTPRQVAAQAAENVNIMFSTQGDWQSIFRFAGDDLTQLSRGLIFSTNESEGLIKGAIRAINPRSPHFLQFADWYAGMFIFMAGVANVIHFSATGKVLPANAYNPIDTDDSFGPFGVGYNNRFLSPQVPFITGRNGLPIYIDIVGQMDTIFNWALDPMSALSARVNVLPRAVASQLTSENFYGEPLQTPGQRAGQAALDLGAPIGVQSAVGAASEAFPPLQQVFPAAESRLGVGGQLAQGSGVNFRAMRNEELRQLAKDQPEMRDNVARELERRQVEATRKDPGSSFTNVLEARLRQARQQGDDLAIRAIEAELESRGESSSVPSGLMRR